MLFYFNALLTLSRFYSITHWRNFDHPMFPRVNNGVSSSSMFNEKNQVFYEQINKELCNINTELRQCEKNLEEICGKLYINVILSDSVIKEYAESQLIINPLIFEDALNLVNFIEELKGKHLD